MCNCGANNPAPLAGMVKDIAVPVTGAMNDANSIKVVLLAHPAGMTQYIGPVTQTRYRVWQWGQTFSVFNEDYEPLKAEGLIDAL